MLNLILQGASYILPATNYVFPITRTVKLFQDGLNITNSTNPIAITKNVTLVVIDCCMPPPVRLAAHCVAAGSLIAASVVSPNPFTVGSAISAVTELYENC